MLPHLVDYTNMLIHNLDIVSLGEKTENKPESMWISSRNHHNTIDYHYNLYIYICVPFSRNLVIALKELSIRGDFRTTVEYLITLLETETFQVIINFVPL